jgi:rhamnose utilization protein RhaD (predicted bifunctional aldolase and dehydrogenase)/NAD(P)-dependent dehydrogenase (short-subunit alcohol dehydrogenase family)
MQNTWSEEDYAGFVAAHRACCSEDLAAAAYLRNLIRSSHTLTSLGRGCVSVKGVRRNVFGEETQNLSWLGTRPDRNVTGECPRPGVLDLAYIRRLRQLAEPDDEVLLDELRTHSFVCASLPGPAETLTHAFLPAKYVCHFHSAAVLAAVSRPDGGLDAGWASGGAIVIPYPRMNFQLANATAAACEANPEARAVIWTWHGVLTWGEMAFAAYTAAINLCSDAERLLDSADRKRAHISVPGGAEQAARQVREVAPVLRGVLGRAWQTPNDSVAPIIIQPITDPEVLSLLASEDGMALAATPPLSFNYLDHVPPVPMWLESSQDEDPEALRSRIAAAIAGYRRQSEVYYKRNSAASGTFAQGEVFPRVVLMPGVGVLCAGPDLESSTLTRRAVAGSLWVRARMAPGTAPAALAEEEIFHREHSLRELEPARTPRKLTGRVAIVTGAAGAIGAGICEVLLREGCAVAIADLPGKGLSTLSQQLRARYGDLVLELPFDVTDPAEVSAAFGEVILNRGGIDLVVANAGIAHVSSLADMKLEAFRRLERVNVEGTLNILTECARHFTLQRCGGDVVLVSTKNVFAPGAKFGAYSATKAAAHQLARIASLEFAEMGVRVNMVAPDAIFRHGATPSGLWAEVGSERARSRGMKSEELEAYYRSRSLLKSEVTAEHVGNAVLFFASRQTPTTGATLPVDAGLPEVTPR